MIIRRRTYSKGFNSSYGYFMRNFNYRQGYSGGSASSTTTLATNIYTKCMLLETPVGTFPLSYRTATSAVSSSGGSPRYIAVGETDGSAIYVVTAKSVYKSLNGGAAFSLVTSNWNSSAYVSGFTGPIVYVDDTYLYILYTEMSYSGSNAAYYNLKLVKILRSNNIVSSTTTIDSIYTTWSSGESNFKYSPFDTGYGTFFALNVSPKGLIMIRYRVYDDRRCWKVYDLPRGVASGIITGYSNAGANYSDGYESTGEWINDGTTYGKFLFMVYDVTLNPYYSKRTYKTVTSSQFSSGASLPFTDITSSLGNLYSNYKLVDFSFTYDPSIFVASCQKNYKNKLFIYINKGANVTNYSFFISDASFGNLEEIQVNKSLILSDLNGAFNNYGMQIAGIYVTPDGNYGVVLWSYAAVVIDLVSKSYSGAFYFGSVDDNGALYYAGWSTCFMLPKK